MRTLPLWSHFLDQTGYPQEEEEEEEYAEAWRRQGDQMQLGDRYCSGISIAKAYRQPLHWISLLLLTVGSV